jgi:uncharacterized cupredoxin-like copper-binding protein
MKFRFLIAAALAALCIAVPIASAASTVNVTGSEFKFKLSPSSSKAGAVTFKFTNKGKLKHDFKIAGKATKVLAPGKSQTISVSLKKGSYKFLCTVKGHEAAGMKGTFKVS